MKKTVKVVKKTNSWGKTTKNPRKKTAKTPGRRKKMSFSDGLRAFLLAGLIVGFSAVVSFAIITIHSSLNRNSSIAQDDGLPQVSINEPASQPLSPQPARALSPRSQTAEGPGTETSPSRQEPAQVTRTAQERPAPAASNPAPRRPPVQNMGTVVFVIDDAGNNLRELEPFLRVPGPLTIAVLPGLPHSAAAARQARAAGKEVILHQPMEALGAQNPGPGAIYSGMGADEIRAILARNIAEVGPVVGINNHQGSKITMDREAMQTILAFCAERGIYFLDSRTTADTVVPLIASQMGMRIAERNVFLDNEQDRGSMQRYIESGLARAQKNGSAVMIGHTWSPALAPLLAEQFPLLTNQGYTIKTASDIIK